MSGKLISTIAFVLAMTLLAPLCSATVAPVTGVTTDNPPGSPPYNLLTVTVGNYTLDVSQLALGISTETLDPVGGTPRPTWDNFEIGGTIASGLPDTLTVHMFGGKLWIDSNGDNPDFFIFEGGDGDSASIAAILPGGQLGQSITLPGNWNGDTGYDSTTNDQDVHGISFAITDLLDADGNPLTNNSIIEGFAVTNRSGMDPSSWFAVAAPVIKVPTNPSPADGSINPQTWATLGWTAGDTAATHDLYVSDNFDDVNDRTDAAFQGNNPSTVTVIIVGFMGTPLPEGLAPGTTYYWAVDEIEADEATKHMGPVWSFSIPPTNAYAPNPSDGASFVGLDATLYWSAGLGAIVHYVHFGDNFDDVNNTPTGPGMPAPTTSFTPGTLEKDKTYYWRVDEYTPPTTTVKGNVWSFTTLPDIPIADPSLIGWWKFDEGMGTVALDWSGHDNHGELRGDPQWVSGQDGGALDFDGIDDFVFTGKNAGTLGIEGDKPKSVAAWVYTRAFNNGGIFDLGTRSDAQDFCLRTLGGTNQWRTQYWGGANDHDFSYDAHNTWVHFTVVYTGTQSTVYANGISVSSEVRTLNTSTANPFQIACYGWQNDYFNGVIDDVRLYSKALTVPEIEQIMRGDTSRPWNPSPANGSISDVMRAASLTWSPGDKASQHAVYFGTDRDAVAGADTSDTTNVFRGLQAGTSYTPPEGVEWGSGSYYWRIDEHNTDGTITRGTVWTFFVADYIIVDDFESYNDIPLSEPGSNLVYVKYKDGLENPNVNGSTMGYFTGESMESDEVHGGNLSVPFQYKNSPAAISEVTRTFTPVQNWAANGVTVLSLWFFGDPTNTPGQLYVKINGVQVNYPGPAADLSRPLWQRWNIDLATVGTNLQSVTSFVIGVSGFGATGTLLLDDIELHRLVPTPPVQIYLEAEAGTRGASWRIYNDPTSSGGQHIGSEDGDGNDNDTVPGPEWTAVYSFNVPVEGIYTIVLRAEDVGSDSFWVRIPGATSQTHENPNQPGTGWVASDIDGPEGEWRWYRAMSYDHNNAVVNWTLPAGTHTLEIAKREDGVLLDAILITDDVD
jgi:hypothetical protein